EFGLTTNRLRLLDPLPYIEFLALQSRAQVVITDSGGIQEETTYLGVPCLTLRENRSGRSRCHSGPMFWWDAIRRNCARNSPSCWRGNKRKGRYRPRGMGMRGSALRKCLRESRKAR